VSGLFRQGDSLNRLPEREPALVESATNHDGVGAELNQRIQIVE
jgi:hypothetical protein